MLPFHFHVAKRADEFAARSTDDRGLLLWMIEATRVRIHDQRFPNASFFRRPEESRKHLDHQFRFATRTLIKGRDIHELQLHFTLAFRARERGGGSSNRSARHLLIVPIDE